MSTPGVHLVQLFSAKIDYALLHHKSWMLSRLDVRQWIPRHCNNICNLAGLKSPGLFGDTKQVGTIGCARNQGLRR